MHSRTSTTCRRSSPTSISTRASWPRPRTDGAGRVKVLGVDPGTAATGYGLVETGPRGIFRLVECGVIRPAPRASLASRLRDIHAGLEELLARHAPDVVAVEEAFYA